MLRFRFMGNRSFIEGAGHPITVPKSQVEYHVLEGALGAVREGYMMLPDDSHVGVRLYEGTAGYGPYYQLRTRSPSRWIREHARVGASYDIQIGLNRDQLEVRAELAGEPLRR